MIDATVSGKDFPLHPPAAPDVYIKETLWGLKRHSQGFASPGDVGDMEGKP